MNEAIEYASIGGPLVGVILIGFLIGVEHTFEADHIIAVSTLLSRESEKSPWKVGSAWGIGHSVTTMVIGALLLLLNIKLPGKIYEVGEIAVGITLIYLGLKHLVFKEVRNTHKHTHGGRFGHLNPMQKWSDWNLMSISVGAIHGFAGSGFLILLLVTTSEMIEGILFLSSFCASIIIIMGIVSQMWGKIQNIHQKMVGNIAGSASIVAGMLLIIGYI